MTTATTTNDFQDFFSTPPAVTRAILPFLPVASALDPCAGDGAILRVLTEENWWRQRAHQGFEIDPVRARTHHLIRQRDALDAVPWGAWLLTITNPPFSGGLRFVRRAIAEANPSGGTVAMLLRLGFMASAERADFHRKHPSDVFVLEGRPSFCASYRCKPMVGRGCGWAIQLPLEAPPPEKCERCGSIDLAKSTNDSSEYAWFVWGPGRGGRWQTLPWDKPGRRAKGGS